MKLYISQGFTLVELLVVIALIGALAVGLLAALDPVDQIRRGQDVSLQNFAKEYIDAQQRYYTGAQAYAGTMAAGTLLDSANGDTAIATLVSSGELKTSFQTAINSANTGGKIYAVHSATTLDAYFTLTSKSFKNNPSLDKCTLSGTTFTCGVTAAACVAATACYAHVAGS